MLELNKKYTACISLLQKIKVLPNEGATESRVVWRNANIGKALDLMKTGNYRKALESIAKSKTWPDNLGVGKPYQVDERLEDFVALQCYQKLNDNKSVIEFKEKVAGKSALQNLSNDMNDFLTAWQIRESADKTEGDRIMKELVEKNPLSKIIQWCSALYGGDQGRAKAIFKEIDRNDQTALLLERVVDELLHLGS